MGEHVKCYPYSSLHLGIFLIDNLYIYFDSWERREGNKIKYKVRTGRKEKD